LTINTSEFKEFVYPTKFESEYLEYLLNDKYSFNSEKIEKNSIIENGKYPVITQEKDKLINGYTNSTNPITNLPIILFGDHSCVFKYINFPFFRGADGIVLLPVKKSVNSKYLFYFLDIIVKKNIENYGKYERHFKYLKRKKIPTPPIEIQQKIVSEIEILEENAKTIVIDNIDFEKEKIIKKYL
jgi:type I restriction enzyme S subunit